MTDHALAAHTENGASPPHPRTIGWIGTTALAMGGSNQSLFLIGALLLSQGSAAIPLLIAGLLLSWAAAPGWTELVLMWPHRVGGIAATCAEAFRPYSPVLANLTGVCYWWGWVPTCGLTAILSATALNEWYLHAVPIPLLAVALVVLFTVVNLSGVRWLTRLAVPLASASALLALLSGLIPVLTGHVNWQQAFTFQLVTPFPGFFGGLTSAMAGLYLVGFAAPAFEAAACHVGETVNPTRNVPRAMLASGLMASLYFVVLPVIWLGVLGPNPLMGDLSQTLGPTFAPLFGSLARAAAIWFMMFNMFHGTLQPLAGAARTLMQMAEDGLLPRVFALRSRTDAPWVATLLTAVMAIAFLLVGDPVWLIAAANLTYLIGIALPNVAVWLLRRDAPHMARPYRAPRGTILLGVLAALVWGVSTVLGFEQFGLPTVLAGIAMAYAGSLLYALRRWADQRTSGGPSLLRSLHLKLTGAMLLVLTLDGAGYLLAVSSVGSEQVARIAALEDIFVAVALLTITVGLVLPGMIAHAVGEVARAAERLARGTLADFSAAMQALEVGALEAAHASVDVTPVIVHTRDEVGAMASSFNLMQQQVGRAALALDGAREGLRQARQELTDSNQQLERWGAELEQRVEERTAELQAAHDVLAAMATIDQLTGLPNHRALLEQVEKETERARRYGRPLSLLFFDGDRFKRVNDTYGHATGDMVLRELGERAKSVLRAGDTVGRYGGEEFIVLLPETEAAEALEVAERLRAAVAALPLALTQIEGGITATISIGLATYPLDGQTSGEVLERADQAMYWAKRLGRNQVRSAKEAERLRQDASLAATIQELERHEGALRDGKSPEQEARAEQLGLVYSLMWLLDLRDHGIFVHSYEVSDLAVAVAHELGLSEQECQLVATAGLLHDIGKIAIPDALLQKSGRLSAREREIIQQHPALGAQILEISPTLKEVMPAIHHHHERWDGSGYPDKLAGERIPLAARIIAVAEAYGAMLADRPYQAARSPEKTRYELERCSGTQFDPAVVQAFLKVVERPRGEAGSWRQEVAQR